MYVCHSGLDTASRTALVQGQWGLRKRVEAIGKSTVQRRLLEKQERVVKLLQDLDAEVYRIEGQLL